MRAIVWENAKSQNAQKRLRSSRRAFTLIDVLVSLAVIALLIGLMLPALGAVRETSRKVVCSSNIRQIGLSTAMYADDFRGSLPYSRNYVKSLTDIRFEPQTLMQAKMANFSSTGTPWDGLGLLYGRQYCSAAQVFYCPSHKSIHRYEWYSDGWNGAPADVLINFQYRGGPSTGKANLNAMPDRIALMSDGLATGFDFSHTVGGNVVASDLSVSWFDNTGDRIDFPSSYTDPAAKDKLQTAWGLIDSSLFR